MTCNYVIASHLGNFVHLLLILLRLLAKWQQFEVPGHNMLVH